MSYGKQTNVVPISTARASGAGTVELQYAQANANRFVAYKPEEKDFYRFGDAGYWELQIDYDEEVRAKDWIVNFDAMQAKPQTITAAVKMLAWECGKLPKPYGTKRDEEDVIVPCIGGYVRVFNAGEKWKCRVEQPTRDLGMTHRIECTPRVGIGEEFEPDGTGGKMFRQFLTQTFQKGEEAVLQEWVGISLMKDSRFHRAMYLYGVPKSGKSTMKDIIVALHRKTITLGLDKLDKFALEGADQASLLLSNEIGKQKVDVEMMKRIISGEEVAIDRKGRAVITTKILGKWLIASNTFFHCPDKSGGFWRRIHVIKLTKSVKNQITNLADKIIESEMNAVLEWALEGLIRVLNRGRLLEDGELPESCRQAKQEFMEESDNILRWINDEGVVIDDEESMPLSDAFNAYKKWVAASGGEPSGERSFWTTMKIHLPEIWEQGNRTGKKVRSEVNGVEKFIRVANLRMPSVAGTKTPF